MTQSTPDPQAPREEGPDDPTGGAAPNSSKVNGSKANGAAEPKPEIPDPFDPEAYRTPPEGEPGSGVEARPTKLKVRNPKKVEFFRCHPTLRLKASALVKEDGFDKLYYLAKPAVAAVNAGEFRQFELCLCTNRDGTLFVWPIPQPSESGRTNEWSVSARDGAHQALTRWVRLKPDQANGQYVVLTARSHIPDPVWPPTMTLRDMIARAFGEGGIIGDEDHPEMKALRGE
jgi:hypothetical protein